MKSVDLKSIDFKSTDFMPIIKKNGFIQKPQKVRHQVRHRSSLPDFIRPESPNHSTCSFG
ncbi:hypothetical protein [Bacteroides finegoldii]|uniref:hypothetical protein n=1 Tax=Bacteroides finegoldii TaxID=338188 RepID=UPI001897B3B3|nr:hypothetical protein [Bacteroides finegoldii]